MQFTKKDIVGEIVAQDERTADVISSFGIDFCCRGNRTRAEAAEQNKISVEDLIGKLEKVQSQNVEEKVDYHAWELDLLADYIEKKHHRYVRRRIPELRQYLAKIDQVHGGQHPEMKESAEHIEAHDIDKA